ncbi:MaoC family dehydratase N-terminal domain-containing protein [Aestuariimicrobium sp. p3-SID1156]|uniref:FAS1-like dehydratase domain-containing protein n=1 Tax=Aestuariimicrobium sp. p3-SID1156 TaxID=2916038 RepID=UPI00223B41DE|nr:MaoC family dehydratase N-terminal domain-containing protein [Aestuariimicrobium sp. p3-SID1156]MCT1458804.1 MaoC family dehydratase N-terminal domain-containing protein [Aestuariimicrobium sp. p3-SID1156]
MAITPEHVGRSYPAPEPYRVSRAKIQEFSAAIMDAHPAYREDPAIAPPTFAMVIAAQAWQSVFEDAELGLALQRMVHTDQALSFTRPLREGDEVDATARIEKVRHRGNVDLVTLAVTLEVGGEEVAIATSSLMHTREEAIA